MCTLCSGIYAHECACFRCVGGAGNEDNEDAESPGLYAWAAAMEAELEHLAAAAAAARAAAGAQLQELRAAALELGQQQMGGLQDLQKCLSECLQDRYELQVRFSPSICVLERPHTHTHTHTHHIPS